MDCGTNAPNETLIFERRLQPRSNILLWPTDKLRRNKLLAALTEDDLRRLQLHLEMTLMPFGQVLYWPGTEHGHVYFPTSSIVSKIYTMENGACSEIALVGKEGVLGVNVFMGGGSSTSGAVVLRAGHGYRIKSQYLLEEFNRGGSLQLLLLRYAQALMTQIIQTAACNQHHTIYQQLCRFLLLMLDRQESNVMPLTQELIAAMLGARRESVTDATGRLQLEGLIRHSRGHIEVLDRIGIEKKSCECYRVVKKEYQRLLNHPVVWH